MLRPVEDRYSEHRPISPPQEDVSVRMMRGRLRVRDLGRRLLPYHLRDEREAGRGILGRSNEPGRLIGHDHLQVFFRRVVGGADLGTIPRLIVEEQAGGVGMGQLGRVSADGSQRRVYVQGSAHGPGDLAQGGQGVVPLSQVREKPGPLDRQGRLAQEILVLVLDALAEAADDAPPDLRILREGGLELPQRQGPHLAVGPGSHGGGARLFREDGQFAEPAWRVKDIDRGDSASPPATVTSSLPDVRRYRARAGSPCVTISVPAGTLRRRIWQAMRATPSRGTPASSGVVRSSPTRA